MIKNIKDKHVYLFFMYFSICLSFLILFIGNWKLPAEFTVLGWMYAGVFVLSILFMKNQFSLKMIILFFLLFEIILFSYSEFSGHFSSIVIGDYGSDETRYHIPHALNLNSFSERVEYAFSTHVQNGRFTHILLSLYISLIQGFSETLVTGGDIFKISFIFNVLISVVTIITTYKAAMIYYGNISLARRSVWFLALNPVFIGMAGSAKKEPILFFAISLFILFIVKGHWKNAYLLVFSSFIIILDRMYTLPILIMTYIFYRKISIKKIFLIIVTVLFLIEIAIGFDRLIYKYNDHVSGMISLKGSLLPGHNLFYDLIRVVFGPSFTRDFSYDISSLSFGNSILTIILYPMMYYKAFFFQKGLSKSILFLFLFVLFLIPFQSTFKILMITILGAFFLEHISFVKYNYNEKLQQLGKPKHKDNATMLIIENINNDVTKN
jgi:hypothetical protein